MPCGKNMRNGSIFSGGTVSVNECVLTKNENVTLLCHVVSNFVEVQIQILSLKAKQSFIFSSVFNSVPSIL